MHILVVGATSWDTIVHVPRLPEPRPQTVFATGSYEALGSTGAGKALNLARLGHEVHLHTLLGDDEPGALAAAALTTGGVHLHVDRAVAGTERHVNVMASDGGRLSIYRNVGAPEPRLDLGPVLELAAGCDVVVLNITDYVRALVAPLAARGLPFWTDLHDWDGVDPYHVDFLAAQFIVLSNDNLADYRTLGRRLATDREWVVCTRGAAGATAWTAGDELDVVAVPGVEVVDTNGAGDAFTAGLIHGHALGWTPARTLRAAALAGAAAVATPALAGPDLSADLLARRSADAPS